MNKKICDRIFHCPMKFEQSLLSLIKKYIIFNEASKNSITIINGRGLILIILENLLHYTFLNMAATLEIFFFFFFFFFFSRSDIQIGCV